MRRLRLLVLAVAALGGGCASSPDPVRDADAGPALSAVLTDPERFIGERVRWGGTIAKVENGAEHTRVYLVGRELFKSGRPRESDSSTGRFVALLPGFHDPVILAAGRELTAVGVLQSPTVAAIGEFEYRYPVVSADTHRLWPKREKLPHYHRRSPFYPYHYHDPWYPYPYFGPRHFH